MSVKIESVKETDGKMTFTISNVDVSYVNGLRRIILSDIPIICFKTTPYEENKAKIYINTSRLNNEIVKQRLSCIPICLKDFVNFDELSQKNPMADYQLEIDVENNTDTTMIVTSKDFKILNISSNKYVDEGHLRKIFPSYIPPNGNGEYYIDFLRLRPKFSDEIPGERIKLSCEFSIGTAGEDATFNVVGTCSYGFTVDEVSSAEQLEIRKQKWKDENKKEEEIKFLATNWKLLEGKRYVIKNSFDFVIESIGIYDNETILVKACNILLKRLEDLLYILDDTEMYKPSDSTLDNCYDIRLENEDYTVGNIINHELYTMFYNVSQPIINYVGFKKMHPHDEHSIIRVAVNASHEVGDVKTMVIKSVESAIKTVEQIKSKFKSK